jgi:hypothetical protein
VGEWAKGDPGGGGAKISARGSGYHFAGWIAPDLSHACGLHRPGCDRFSGLSKPGEVVHPRSGSKPARNSFSGWPHPRRAEFFAPPVEGFHTPFRPFAHSPPNS